MKSSIDPTKWRVSMKYLRFNPLNEDEAETWITINSYNYIISLNRRGNVLICMPIPILAINAC